MKPLFSLKRNSSSGSSSTSESPGKVSGSLSVGDKIKLFFLANKILKNMKNALDSMEGFKTIIASIIGLISLFTPAVESWVAANPQFAGSSIIIAYLILRVITKKPIGSLQYSEPEA